MPRDPEKAIERQRRYRARKHAERFGAGAGDQRGRHGRHARGVENGRWNAGRIITSHGYVARRVALDHPHGWGPPGSRHLYAYEHIIVAMEIIGRPLSEFEVVHHRNGRRDDNRAENLEITTRSAHAREHSAFPGARDARGRFRKTAPRSGDPAEWPEDLRVREFPEAR